MIKQLLQNVTGQAWWANVRERRLQPEQMDQPGLDETVHRSALRGLQFINAFCLTHRSFWRPIRRLAVSKRSTGIRILDVACGGGDVALRLALAAKRQRLPIVIDGCDISATAISVAAERAKAMDVSSRFFQFDVLNEKWPEGYDVIMTSLFLHHLTADAVVHVLQSMARASQTLVLVNDLVRSRVGYLLARFGGPILSRSPIVHSDGPVSVINAFTPQELRDLAQKAGLHGAAVSNLWPARMLLQWNRA